MVTTAIAGIFILGSRSIARRLINTPPAIDATRKTMIIVIGLFRIRLDKVINGYPRY